MNFPMRKIHMRKMKIHFSYMNLPSPIWEHEFYFYKNFVFFSFKKNKNKRNERR